MSQINRQVGQSISSLTREFELITHNLANVNTPAYKRRCNAFTKALEDKLNSSEAGGELHIKESLDFTQGSLKQTGRALDLALNGDGFFVLETPQGPVYTRNGSFQINRNGQIVDSAGRLVQGQNGPVSVPLGTSVSQIMVSGDGTVSLNGNQAGKLRIVTFGENLEKLKPAGNSGFTMSDPEVKALDAENVTIKQGYQEASNVKMVEELVDMIMVSRLYEANMKFMTGNREASRSLMQVAMG